MTATLTTSTSTSTFTRKTVTMPDAPVSPRDLLVVSVTDASIDRNAPSQDEALARYAERRTVDALAAIRLWTNNPAVFHLRALSARARTAVLSESGTAAPGDRYSPRQLLAAARAGIVAVIREATITDGIPTGPEEVLPTIPETAWPLLTDEALDALGRDYGGAVLDELGALVLDRSALNPRRIATFSLPRSARDQI